MHRSSVLCAATARILLERKAWRKVPGLGAAPHGAQQSLYRLSARWHAGQAVWLCRQALAAAGRARAGGSRCWPSVGGCRAGQVRRSDDIRLWKCTIPGKQGTAWEGGQYPVRLLRCRSSPNTGAAPTMASTGDPGVQSGLPGSAAGGGAQCCGACPASLSQCGADRALVERSAASRPSSGVRPDIPSPAQVGPGSYPAWWAGTQTSTHLGRSVCPSWPLCVPAADAARLAGAQAASTLTARARPQEGGWRPSITVKQVLLGIQVRGRSTAAARSGHAAPDLADRADVAGRAQRGRPRADRGVPAVSEEQSQVPGAHQEPGQAVPAAHLRPCCAGQSRALCACGASACARQPEGHAGAGRPSGP